MRSLCCLKSRVRRVQHALQSAGLGLLVLAGTVGAADKARAQDEASVLLCDLTYTVKLKRLKKSFASFNDDFTELWSAQREGDKRDKCKRYFQSKDSKRLSKLVDFGKKNEVAYVVAPAAGKKGRDVELSFWLVDVAAEKMITEFATKVSSKSKQYKKDVPGALEESVTTLIGALNTDLAEKAPPKEEPAPEEPAPEEPAPEEATAEVAAADGAAAAPAAAPAPAETAPAPAAAASTEDKSAAAPASAVAETAPAPAAAVPAAEAPAPAAPEAKKEGGLRGILVGVSSGMIGVGAGGVMGGALISVAGGQVRGWEKTAAIAADDRSELNNVLNGMAVLADATTIGLLGVSVVGAGLLTATLLFVEE